MKNRFFRGFLTLCFAALPLLALSAGIRANAAEFSGAGESSDAEESLKTFESYADSEEIQSRYREAVSVISAIKIMEGYKPENGEGEGPFRPQGTLTRGAAAKIIANLAITPDDGELYKMVIQKTPFVDVAQSHVFSSHIFYCSQQNLISGDENHRFNPGSPLTYNAFLKMLLCVLGHNQYAEGYTGEGWQLRVQADAKNNGLLNGLPEDFSIRDHGGEAITREIAALFAFNALLANQVDYSDGVAMPRLVDLNAERYDNIRSARICNANGQEENQLVQFGEERFPDLRRDIQSTYGDSVTVLWSYTVKKPNGDKERRAIGNPYTNINPFQDYFVFFDRNDENGASSIKPKTVTNGGVYGGLPTPDGSGFLGWFTLPGEGGERITDFSPVWLDRDKTLYAHWRAESDVCSLTFDVDGDTHVTLRATKGSSLLEWPAPPSRDDAEFIGWVESVSGEVPALPLTVTSDLLFHASYHALNSYAQSLTREDFAYRFDNSARGFGYAAGFDTRMLVFRYKLIFGSDALAKQIYLYDVQQNGYEWRGNCYGMSTTAGMFQYPDNGINIADFADPESRLKKPWEIHELTDEYFHRLWEDVTPNEPLLTLKKFIEAMQVSQKTISFVKTFWENAGDLNGLCKEVTRVSENQGGAVVICIYNRDAGHALLGYALEELNERTSRIRVYDSNFPNEMRYLTLTKDSHKNYTRWSYDDAREYNTDVKDETEGTLIRWGSMNDGTITYIPYEKYYEVWQRRGNQDISMNLLTTDLTDAVIYDGSGRQIASFRNGEIENPDDIRRNGVYPLVDLEENPFSAPRKIAVWLPDSSEYRIQNNAAYPAEQTISLSNVGRSVSVTTTARIVTLSVDKVKTLQANQSADKKNQKEFILRAAAEGENAALQIRAEGVSLPPRVDAPPSPDKSVTWYGSTRSQMELTLNLLYDGTIHSMECVGDGETNAFSVNGENMTELLKNAPDGVIRFDDIFG